MSSASTNHGYGYCPRCGAPGVLRERRPDGNDKCENGHTYPSHEAANVAVNAHLRRMLASDPDGVRDCVVEYLRVWARESRVLLPAPPVGDLYAGWPSPLFLAEGVPVFASDFDDVGDTRKRVQSRLCYLWAVAAHEKATGDHPASDGIALGDAEHARIVEHLRRVARPPGFIVYPPPADAWDATAVATPPRPRQEQPTSSG